MLANAVALLQLTPLRVRRALGVLASALLASPLLVACGLKLDTGSGSGSMGSPEQTTEQAQPRSGAGGSTNNVPPEAALGPGRLRNFALQGSAQYSVENASYLQCGFGEQWSVVFEGLALERLEQQALSEECDIAGCLFALTGAGDLSPRGRFGQIRTYPREITVTSLKSLERVTRAADLVALNDLSCPQ